MKYTNKTVERIDGAFMRLADLLAKISGLIIVLMMCALFFDMVLSKILNGGIPRTMEIVTYFHVPVVYLALLMVQMTETHATVDLLYDKFGRTAQKVLNLIWNVLGVGICGFETYTSVKFTMEKIALNTLSNTKGGFHVWPFAAAMALGWFLMGLSYIWCFVRTFYRVEGSGDPASAEEVMK